MKNILLGIFVSISVLAAGEHHVDKNKPNVVKFISDAPIENFEGITDKIDGYVYWEGEALTNKSSIYLEVDLNSLDTGIGLRNRHMRENYLETDKYPITYFQGKIISTEQSTPENIMVQADGKIFIHGKEKELKVTGEMAAVEKGFRIKTSFIVKLSDFGIEIPSIMFYKIDENMDLQLDFYIIKVNE